MCEASGPQCNGQGFKFGPVRWLGDRVTHGSQLYTFPADS
jgi:hypothetical protein